MSAFWCEKGAEQRALWAGGDPGVELGFTFGSVRSPKELKQRVRGERAETKTKVKRCGLDPLAVVSADGDGFFRYSVAR